MVVGSSYIAPNVTGAWRRGPATWDGYLLDLGEGWKTRAILRSYPQLVSQTAWAPIGASHCVIAPSLATATATPDGQIGCTVGWKAIGFPRAFAAATGNSASCRIG